MRICRTGSLAGNDHLCVMRSCTWVFNIVHRILFLQALSLKWKNVIDKKNASQGGNFWKIVVLTSLGRILKFTEAAKKVRPSPMVSHQ